MTGSVFWRIFFLLAAMSFGSGLAMNLIWLPSAIQEIKEAQSQERRTSIRLIRDQIERNLEHQETQIKNTAIQMRPYYSDGDRERLRLIMQRHLQSDSELEEMGILNDEGRELVKVSRRTAITEQDLADRSATPLFRDGMRREIYWGAVTVSETSEPRVIVAVHVAGSGLVFGMIHLKSLLSLIQDFRLDYDGRAYVVDETGRLIAAGDPSLMLRQLSFSDRPFIQQLIDPRRTDSYSPVEGGYLNETKQQMAATGLSLKNPPWAVVIEQPESLLFAPIREKIWFFVALSLISVMVSFVLAQRISRRFTKPIIDLSASAERIGAGNFQHRVAVTTDDEIGELAKHFNLMAERLLASQQATLSALTIPIISRAGELQQVLDEVTQKVMKLTGADAASIRLLDDAAQRFVFSVYQGFSENYIRERPAAVSEEAGVGPVLETGEPLISGNLSDNTLGEHSPLLKEGFRSAVFLPLKTPKKSFGVMTLATREAGRFGLKQADLFAAIAHQISVALQNARLFQDTERDLERIGVLHEIVSASTSSLNLRSVLDLLLEKIATLLPYDAVTVQLLDKTTGRLEQVACRNIDESEWRAAATAGHAPATPESGPVIVRDTRTDRRTSGSDFLRRHHLISFVQLPLLPKNEVLGTITFFQKQEHEFSGDEVEFLSTLADQAAGAICNAELYERSTEQAVELKKANKLQADFSAMIVHDLRSPLATMIGIVDMIKEGLLGELNADQKNWMERIRTNASGLVELVGDFLDLSKLEAGRLELTRAPTDLADLVRRTIDNFAPLARGKKIELTFQPEEALPVAEVDARRLEQVFNNLLSNALKFTSEGGSITVTARTTEGKGKTAGSGWQAADGIRTVCEEPKGKGFVELSVRDTGIGIPRDEIPSLFQKYRQVHAATLSAQKGTGLGLLICKMIVEAHGGEIWADSEEGKGATFTLTLPLHMEADQTAPSLNQRILSDAASANLASK